MFPLKPKVYIDGKEGTTGLQIYDRLAKREDIELLLIDEDKRKDPAERKKLMDASDIVFLCLPDAAAIEVYPLVAAGLLPPDADLSCFSLTGYSGGGKKMIAQYEAADRPAELASPCPYGLGQTHKHLPEMQTICGLAKPPVFVPVVDDYYKGMATTVMLHTGQLKGVTSLHQVWEAYAAHYAGQQMVKVAPEGAAKLYAGVKAGDNDLQIVVAGNDASFTVTALFDNLGKGASGAAVQNMNIMLGLDEATGLTV